MGTLHLGFNKAIFFQKPHSKIKEEIEIEYLDLALKAGGWNFYNLKAKPVQLKPTNSIPYDFRLMTIGGSEYLDVIEVADELKLSRDGYNKIPYSYFVGELTEWIFKKAKEKSDKYKRRNSKLPVHLLIYNTDLRFTLSEEVLDLLAYKVKEGQLIFKTISYVNPNTFARATFQTIYPRSEESFFNFDAEKVGKMIIVIGDISNPLQQSDGSVDIPIQFSGSHQLNSLSVEVLDSPEETVVMRSRINGANGNQVIYVMPWTAGEFTDTTNSDVIIERDQTYLKITPYKGKTISRVSKVSISST